MLQLRTHRHQHLLCFALGVHSRVLFVEGSPSVFGGVRPSAGERAGAGPAEGGRVSVRSQGDARQDPGYGTGVLLQNLLYRLISLGEHTIVSYDLAVSLYV